MTSDQIRKILKSMTPGPWKVAPSDDGTSWYIVPPSSDEDSTTDPPIADLIYDKCNANGIALSSTLQPLLFEIFDSLMELAEHIKPDNGQKAVFKRLDDAIQAVHALEHPEI